ncbi:hypothetical protein SO694_00072051 [Aureococcus anophagefferens]|uniref:Uncharacterized protein n=1 Tax=Aureococcus anophagefferens TaxID=44056 RepID=A0ABR1FIF0_AURAN
MYSMHAILALAVGAAAFGSSSTSSEDFESIEATLDHVEEMVRFRVQALPQTPASQPLHTAPRGLQPHLHAVRAHRHHDARHGGVDPDDYSTLDDYQLPMRRRLEDGESLGVLGLGSADLNLFERAGFVVPFDWECQTGTSGGVYPENNTYSEDGYWYGGFECPSALLSDGELVDGLGGQLLRGRRRRLALYDDGESYSANVTEVTGSDITVTYSDDDTSTYDLTESGNVVQTASGADCVRDLRLVDARHGGLLDGRVHFKPDNAERTVYINEQVEYEYETDIDRRLSTAEAVLGDIDLTLPIDPRGSSRRVAEPYVRAVDGALRGGAEPVRPPAFLAAAVAAPGEARWVSAAAARGGDLVRARAADDAFFFEPHEAPRPPARVPFKPTFDDGDGDDDDLKYEPPARDEHDNPYPLQQLGLMVRKLCRGERLPEWEDDAPEPLDVAPPPKLPAPPLAALPLRARSARALRVHDGADATRPRLDLRAALSGAVDEDDAAARRRAYVFDEDRPSLATAALLNEPLRSGVGAPLERALEDADRFFDGDVAAFPRFKAAVTRAVANLAAALDSDPRSPSLRGLLADLDWDGRFFVEEPPRLS